MENFLNIEPSKETGLPWEIVLLEKTISNHYHPYVKYAHAGAGETVGGRSDLDKVSISIVCFLSSCPHFCPVPPRLLLGGR